MFTKYLPYLLDNIVENVMLKKVYQKVNIYVFILIAYYVKGVIIFPMKLPIFLAYHGKRNQYFKYLPVLVQHFYHTSTLK